jgi:hypothetical protein
MLVVTQLLTPEERADALSVVPWHQDLRALAGVVHGALRNQTIDVMESSLPASHARAGLAALQEGLDALFQSSVDLVESVAVASYLDRCDPADPLGTGQLISPPEDPARLRLRLARCALEAAAVRSVSGGDHLANAHLRLAWEANAATADELRGCGFDPDQPEPKTWASSPALCAGLKRLEIGPTAVFPFFAGNEAFANFITAHAVTAARTYRNALVHRARPSYRESPSLGRNSLWADGEFSLTLRPFSPKPDESLPTLDDMRALIADATGAALPWARELWEIAIRWLATVGIAVQHRPEAREVKVRIDGWGYDRFPRAQRDPAPFLSARAPFANGGTT